MESVLSVQNIEKYYGSKGAITRAINHISLEVGEGEFLGIMGASGSGKTTLLNCISTIDSPTAGSILFEGVDITKKKYTRMEDSTGRTVTVKVDVDQHRQKMGMVFQHFNLFPHMTILDNMTLAPIKVKGVNKKEAEEKALSLLDRVGLKDRADAYPIQLSGGQKQRVAIARALASDPKVLLCDEATSALDPQTTRSILKLIQKINRETGITVVIITHEMAVGKEICHRVAVMEAGRVVELGQVYDIFAQPQQAVTRSFVATTSNLGKVEELLANNDPLVALKSGQIIARLNYGRNNVSEATISQMSRKFDVDVSIIYSNMEILDGSPLGGLVAILSGEKITEAVNYLSEQNVMVEVLKRG